mmetsp:Transcript_16898/g.42124  ORF Transcript_16898/g.42124 Transcript_16898/m.42124 type:complete len:159 (+) Transcript_16898:86-562(+)
MFNYHGEPVDLAKLSAWPVASVSIAGISACSDEPTDFAVPTGRRSASVKAAEAIESAGQQQPWWYRLLIPSDSGTVVTLGERATSESALHEDAVASMEDEESSTSRHAKLSAEDIDAARQVWSRTQRGTCIQLGTKIDQHADLVYVTVVGKRSDDWEA